MENRDSVIRKKLQVKPESIIITITLPAIFKKLTLPLKLPYYWHTSGVTTAPQ
jgi:hypothetical protein